MTAARLRRALPSDAAAIAALHLAARRDAMPYLPALQSDEEVRAWTRDTLLPKAEVWVAEIAGEPVGYLALVDDILDHLYVGPGRQGQGVGSLLLAKAKALRPAGLRLYAFQRNRRARAFLRGPRLRAGGASRMAPATRSRSRTFSTNGTAPAA